MTDIDDQSPSGDPLPSEFAGDADMMQLVESFVDELQGRIEGLRSALMIDDIETIRILAHQLKGVSGGYGYPAISSSAGEVERVLLAGESEVAGLQERVEDLIHLCRRATMVRAR